MSPPQSVSSTPEAETAIPPPGFASIPQLPSPAYPDPPSPGMTPGPGPQEEDGPGPGAEPYIPASTDGEPGPSAPAGPPLSFRARARSMTKLASTGFEAVAGLLNRALSTGDGDDVFLPDDDDMNTIPPPIGRLAARRLDLPLDEEGLTDAQDMLAAAIGLGAWAIKGLVDYLGARRRARQVLAGRVIHVDGEDEQ